MEDYNSHYSVKDADEYEKFKNGEPWWESCHNYSSAKLLGDISGLKVLELGCGTGRMCKNLINWGAAKVVGLDISEPMIAQAKKNSDSEKEEYHVKDCFDLEHLDYFDVSVSYFVMHYASSHKELNGYIRAAYDNLKPGGLMVGTVPCLHDNLPLTGRLQSLNASYKREKYGLFEPVYVQLGSNANNPGVSVITYSLYPDIVEKAFQEAGFGDFTWHSMEMSKESEKYMKVEDLEQDNACIFLFKARKPVS